MSNNMNLINFAKKDIDIESIVVLRWPEGHEFLDSYWLSFQLVSATQVDPGTGKGYIGESVYLDENNPTSITKEGDYKYTVSFPYLQRDKTDVPGAVIVKRCGDEFRLSTMTLEGIGEGGQIVFDCNSWVYSQDKYDYDCIFFTNDPCLPNETPVGLIPFRQEELEHLRGKNIDRELKIWDRIYDYECYNDLGNPDKDPSLDRPILGGPDHPYPRRGKTGRPLMEDKKTESRLPPDQLDQIYVPRDERSEILKAPPFSLPYAIMAFAQFVTPIMEDISIEDSEEFESFQDVLRLYMDQKMKETSFTEMFSASLLAEGARSFDQFPRPKIIHDDNWIWQSDEEFAREVLAGINPMVIKRLEEFPPKSNLDPSKYGDQNSKITRDHIESNLNGHTVEEALRSNKLFILDHHDFLIPYLGRINSTDTKMYATRTLFFLQKDSTLKPLAIELSKLFQEGEEYGNISKVYTPSIIGTEKYIWQLAKAYVVVCDSGYHQLISHWLHTHATMEPFVIATNRCLSVIHPINKLLVPHYRNTMHINALAREILINAGGIFETTFFPAKYSMELSSMVYKNEWNFNDQALPVDLHKRGIVAKDGTKLIEDYPYADDGIRIWFAIEKWVTDYCLIYYTADADVENDAELQSWWKEIREEGHGDRKDELGWPDMKNVDDLIKSCTIIIWVASALHASVNFGQFDYAGYHPNRPTLTRRFMPEPGSEEYKELSFNPDKFFLGTLTNIKQTFLGLSLIQLLSLHFPDEVYLGQRRPEWTNDEDAIKAFGEFASALDAIATEINTDNKDETKKNRYWPAKMSYTLLYPASTPGITGKGIPNSVSI